MTRTFTQMCSHVDMLDQQVDDLLFLKRMAHAGNFNTDLYRYTFVNIKQRNRFIATRWAKDWKDAMIRIMELEKWRT